MRKVRDAVGDYPAVYEAGKSGRAHERLFVLVPKAHYDMLLAGIEDSAEVIDELAGAVAGLTERLEEREGEEDGTDG